jgi:hypothetical protein
MRKIELIDLISDYLNGGDGPDDIKGRFHDQIIKKHIEAAFNNVVFQTFMEGKRYQDYSTLDAWAKNYPLVINSIANGNGNVRLPYPPMQLPDNMGILQVTPSTPADLTNAFAYRETNANAVFAALDSFLVSTKPTFYLEQNATGVGIETHVLQLEKIPDAVTHVNVKLIVNLEFVDDFDQVPIPAGKESLIIQGVIELIRGKPPEDLVNDNKPSR